MELVVQNVREEESQENKYMKGVKHLCESGVLTAVPTKFILPISDRPNVKGEEIKRAMNPNLKLPVIDISQLQTSNRPQVLSSVAKACEEHGFFQVVNHGISSDVIQSMIDVSKGFFDLPFEERKRYMSSDIWAPVRYGTSLNQKQDGVFFWRDFLKLNCQPSSLPYWPSSPIDLRQEAISYSQQIRNLFKQLMGAILNSLGLDMNMMEDFNEGSQLMVINCFPPCPEPDLTLGMPPHSDYGFLTLVLNDGVKGLQIQCQGEWVNVEPLPDSLIVNVGDHLEIFSNGRYKSVLHRVLVNSSKSRISVASIHSLPLESIVSPSSHLVNQNNPRLYMDTDYSAFLTYMSSKDTTHKSFLHSRKLTSRNNATTSS